MKVKVDGQKLYDAMVAKLERMQPRMDKLNYQQRQYEEYQKLKYSTPWYKRFLIWKYFYGSPYKGIHNMDNSWYRMRYEELALAIQHMKTDESYFIDSLDFGSYGL